MKKITMGVKKRTFLFIFLLLIFASSSFIIVGCTSISERSSPNEKNRSRDFTNSTSEIEYSNDYFNYDDIIKSYINKTDNASNNSNYSNNMSNNKLIISFRIDDITFNSNQKQVIENAIYLARKYNITFDLAVIASRFENNADPEVIQLYENNKDILEIGAHGYNHQNPNNRFGKGEFFNLDSNTSVQYNVQEDHISKMKTVFAQNNIDTGTKIFFVPWHAGDNNTIDIAEQYGYEIMTQRHLPSSSPFYYYKNIIVTPILIGVKMNETLTESDISDYMDSIHNVKKRKLHYLEIVFHPVNFYDINSTEKFVRGVVTNFSSSAQFDFVSTALNE